MFCTVPISYLVECYPARTWIFILDSLGLNHDTAVKNLAGYLELEAMDKKGISETNEATGKQAMVISSIIVIAS